MTVLFIYCAFVLPALILVGAFSLIAASRRAVRRSAKKSQPAQTANEVSRTARPIQAKAASETGGGTVIFYFEDTGAQTSLKEFATRLDQISARSPNMVNIETETIGRSEEVTLQEVRKAS